MADSTRTSGDVDALEVRPARAEDREPVLAFCARTWEDGDYIASVWDDWLSDETSVLLVGVTGGRPVAIAHMRMVSLDEAWLEGIRVDPQMQRQGIGRAMLSRALAAARERGASVARLCVEQDNTASQRLVARFGFTRVAEVALYVGPALTEDEEVVAGEAAGGGEPSQLEASAGPRLRAPGVEAFEEIWAWLVQSNLSPFNGGLEFAGWTARALTEPLLQAYLTAGEVWLLEEHSAILALAVIHDEPAAGNEPAWLDVRYMDGLAESIGRLALTLREVAAVRGQVEVDLWLPDLLILRDAMSGAAYRRETEGALWVYARSLAPSV
jgi:ribosomal protein S18 acetylase RimI-like enzyme